MTRLISAQSWGSLYHQLNALFLDKGQPVHTEKWQGVDISKRPEAQTIELLNTTICVDLHGSENLATHRKWIKPNLPWADDHFAERVCGEPLNPGVQWAKWPWGNSADAFRNEHGQFNHSYMERLWPKYAGMTDQGELGETFCDPDHVAHINRLRLPPSGNDYEPVAYLKEPHRGIRWEYGDLLSLVELLAKEPMTRQAYIPLFFPEDTGIGDGGRKPCTLGYQVIVRDMQAHMYYPLRSQDYVRHFRDDVYLAVRLLLWIIDRCRERNQFWRDVKPGTFTMHATSLHVFVNDMAALKERV